MAHAEMLPHRPPHFLVRWRVVFYVLLVLAALFVARAGIEMRKHAPAPPNVESDD